MVGGDQASYPGCSVAEGQGQGTCDQDLITGDRVSHLLVLAKLLGGQEANFYLGATNSRKSPEWRFDLCVESTAFFF